MELETIAADGDDCTGSSPAVQWSDLPDDLLGMVRCRVASPRDCVRLAAVCRPWRAAASRQPAPPAAVPQLLLSRYRPSKTKHICGPDNGWVLRVPEKAKNAKFVGSYDGGWVAAIRGCELVLLNLFSSAEVAVCPPVLEGRSRHVSIVKVIFSAAPTSSRGCILAAITDDCLNVALCKVTGVSGWTTQGCAGCHHKLFTDITFCNGDLYALKLSHKEVIKFKISMKEDGSPMITAAYELSIQICDGPTRHDDLVPYSKYIVELEGKLLIAVRAWWLTNHEPFFKVFKLVNTETVEAYDQKWAEVTSLGNYALFLGPVRSKMVQVPVGAERQGLERNHIYYSQLTCSMEKKLPGDEVYSIRLDSDHRMYCKKDQTIGDGLERTGYYIMGWDHSGMWLDPPTL